MAITKEQAQRLVEVAQAIVDGKRVTVTCVDRQEDVTEAFMLIPGAVYTIHEPPPEPKWRPFKDDQEFKPFRSKWIKWADPADDEERSERFRCDKYDLDGIWLRGDFVGYIGAFGNYVFDDETSSPFGVKE